MATMVVRVTDIREWDADRPITMLTAYDTPTARIVDEAGIDMILVGDSVGNTMLGYENTLPVTIEQMMSHTSAVARGAENALVIADMPFLSYGASRADAIEHCGRMLKEANAAAIKLESGPHTVELTEELTNLGIPVQAHLGLTPQHEHQLGGLARQGTRTSAAEQIIELSSAHETAGAFSLVLEHVPANLAERITNELEIPTIGIGAGTHCDGQVLVVNDVIGLSERAAPFSAQFGEVGAEMRRAIDRYRDAVVQGEYPGEEHSHVEPDLFES